MMNATALAVTDLQNREGGIAQPSEKARNGIPRLEPGDHLNRVEFERRYEAMPAQTKAELIEGIVYMPSPVSILHGESHAAIVGWLFAFRALTPGVRLADNTSLRLDLDNELQPDAMLFLDEQHGGSCRTTDKGFVEGSPELIVEVAASTASYDMHEKLRVYRRNGVREYLVLLTLEKKALWHALEEGEYRLIESDEENVLRSRVFPGLWLHAEHFWTGQVAGLMAVLNEGTSSEEHGAYVAHLTKQVEGDADAR